MFPFCLDLNLDKLTVK
uniref:Uncharacterized protein n=1 Tax=Anguilla anguilla TaxID=7936 RepID=A0A0E9RY45_ANGAN